MFSTIEILLLLGAIVGATFGVKYFYQHKANDFGNADKFVGLAASIMAGIIGFVMGARLFSLSNQLGVSGFALILVSLLGGAAGCLILLFALHRVLQSLK